MKGKQDLNNIRNVFFFLTETRHVIIIKLIGLLKIKKLFFLFSVVFETYKYPLL
jgi:hypothetical protein